MMSSSRRATALAAGVAVGLATLVPAASVSAKLRVGNNYRQKLENITPRANDAVGLAVDPNDRKHIVSVNADMLQFECEYGVSFDGGKTWKGGDLKTPEGFPGGGCSPVGHGWSAMDGSVMFANSKKVYTTYATARDTEGGSEGQSVLVAKSTDGGKTFDVPTVAMEGGPNTVDGPDYRFPKLVVDGNKIWVVAYHRARPAGLTPVDKIVMSVSTDGGKTWSGPREATVPGERGIEHTQPVLDDQGALYVGWRTVGFEGSVIVGKTTDDGLTWTRTTAAPVVGFDSGTTQFTASTFPRLASDLGNGNLYLVYGQGPVEGGGYPGQAQSADHFIHKDMDVLFVRSLNGGQSWSTPVVINDTSLPDLTQTRHPNISVAPNGRVDVVWHDRRHSYKMQTCSNTHSPPAGTAPCLESRFGDTYFSYSKDAGATWSADRRISDRSQNNDVGYDYRFGVYWDFGPVSVPLGNNKVFFGWMDSRLGNFTNDNLDIFYATLNLKAKGGPRVNRITSGGTTGLSKALSKAAYMGGSEARLASTFATQAENDLVIVNRKDVPAAIAGGVLGRANLGSVLLSGSGGLPKAVTKEVKRFTAATGAYVLGSSSKLGQGVIDDLVAAGVPLDGIVRIEGGTAAEQAAAIALELDRRSDADKTAGVPAFDAAIIANPNRKDAAAAAGLAAHRRLPVLYVDKGSVPQATTDALDALDIDKTLVIGGGKSVGSAVLSALPSPQRLGSNKLYDTSRAIVAESRARHMPDNIVYIANGGAPMEAALLGHVVGRAGGLMLLARNASARHARNSLDKLGLLGGVDKLVIARTK